MAKLTTTSYAILGLLQRRPWSAYELTKYMQHSGIRAVWPRTESRLYVEFKNLVAHELATAQQETKQGRKRSVYRITPEGRKHLQRWLRSTEGGVRLESEPLLKLLYVDLEKTAKDTQLTHMKQQLRDEVQLMHDEIESVLERGFFFDENAIQNAQLISLLTDMLVTRSKWLGEMSDGGKLGQQVDDEGEEALRIYKKEVKRLERLLGELGG